MNLVDVLPDLEEVPESLIDEVILDSFHSWTSGRGIRLYPAQEEAVFHLLAGDNVILATPTGSGKSMVAIAAHFIAMARKQRTFYTAPIKALVNEKFFALCEIFGAESVGMMTGDATVNRDAPIICATAEIVANIALREGPQAAIGQVIMDEFHYYSEPQRGWAWQVPLLELPQTQFLLMSATLGDTEFLETDLSRRTGRDTVLVGSDAARPVPLEFDYVYTPIHETIEQLVEQDKAPVYVVHFSQREAIERAQSLLKIDWVDKATKEAIAQTIGDFRFSSKFGETLSKLVRRGIGVHHAGMLPKYRRLVERLSQAGLLKVICGTDTLGVGINVPIRCVLFSGLAKYDGQRSRIVKSREFHQIAGRAGRAGFDTVGYVVIQATEHEIENYRLRERAGTDKKKLKKLRLKSAREGEVTWTEKTYAKLLQAPSEPLSSQFKVSNSMVLNLLARDDDKFSVFRHILRTNHNSRQQQNKDILTALEYFRGLSNAGVISPTAGGYSITEDLQLDFALNQPLSPFALAALELLDKESETHTLDIISIFEAILEDPWQVLSAQQHKAREQRHQELKNEGVDYTERQIILDEITWPQPLKELLEQAYSMYVNGHPWAKEFDYSPKSIVREMIEQGMTFSDLIAEYGLARSEGVVLRYLNDVWRTLSHSVPPDYLSDELADIIDWLGETIRLVDSSLMDEWARMADPSQPISEADLQRELAFGVEDPSALSANKRALKVMVRNFFFRLVQLFAQEREEDLEESFSYLDAAPDWVAALDDYFGEYDDLDVGPAARGSEYFQLDTSEPRQWKVVQTLRDPEDDHAFQFHAVVDLDASDAADEIRLSSLEIKQA